MKNKNYILFTGLVRNEQFFLEKLQKVEELKALGYIDGIIFSTWIGELKKYKAAQNKLNEIGALIIETDEPSLKLHGHVVHQAKTLYYGLKACPENAFVYKTRPDLAKINLDVLSNCFLHHEDLKIDHTDGWPAFFKYKVVIHGGLLLHPFYINDIHYFGFREDLLKLAHFDISFEVIYNHVAAEQYFFAKNFINIDLFQAYFSMNQPILQQNPELTGIYIKYCFESTFMAKVIAAYWKILQIYFITFDDISKKYKKIEFNIEEFLDGRLPYIQVREQAGKTLSFSKLSWMQQFQKKAMKNQDTLLIGNFLKEYEDYLKIDEYLFNPVFSKDEEKKHVFTLQEVFGNKGTKIAKDENRKKMIHGTHMRCQILKRDSYVDELERQINHMRRELQELKARNNK